MRVGALAVALLLPGCIVGNGEGWIEGAIYLPACGFGSGRPPDVEASEYAPVIDSFFGDAIDRRMVIRLQVGGADISVSDGLTIEVVDRAAVVRRIRDTGEALVQVGGTVDPAADPPVLVGRAWLYLNGACPGVFVDFASGQGVVRFTSMYAREDTGDHADIDHIEGGFAGLMFRDERPEAAAGGVAPWAELNGRFSFPYRRGRPAQPFP